MSLFRMPSLGADMEAGTLVEWLVQPGAPVKRGDPIAVVETQKGAIEIEVFEDGMFDHGLVEIGARVPVGTPLAVITGPGERKGTEVEEAVSVPPAEKPPAPTMAPPSRAPTQLPASQARVKATPAARQLAAQSGIDLSTLTGSGPNGEIVVGDVAALVAKAPRERAAEAPPEMSAMRSAIATAMAHSKREIPHYYLAHTVDLSGAEAWLTRHNAEREPSERLLMAALFVKAVARAAQKHPDFNGHYVDGAHRTSAAVHVGLAINIRGVGLVAPAIHNADQLDLDALMGSMRSLVARVRAGRFRGSEIADPTITVSSIGEPGVESLYGVIYPPQVAIVGFGMPVLRAWVAGDSVVPRRTVQITLAGDHRVSDGHRGAVFLNTVGRHLLEPASL